LGASSGRQPAQQEKMRKVNCPIKHKDISEVYLKQQIFEHFLFPNREIYLSLQKIMYESEF